MKKTFAMVLAVLTLVLALSGCGGGAPNGTYSAPTGTMSYSFEKGEASLVTNGVSMPLGKAEVKDGDLYIAGVKTGTYKNDTVTISGVDLVKQK